MFFSLQRIGIGFVLRDSKGNCIMAASIRETDALNQEIVEVAAILRELQQCMHMGILHLIIESDCQFVVDKI